MGRYSLPQFSFLAIPAILVLTVLSSVPAAGQAGGGSVIGQVRVVPGDFVPVPVLVNLQGRGALVGSVYTDPEGHFWFNQLPGNIYHVVINEKDYEPVDEAVEIDPKTAAMRMVNINLKPRATAQPSVPATAGGSNPNLANAAEFTKAIPKAARKEHDKGVEADNQQKTDLAIQHYEKAVQLSPDFYAARNNLGSDYMKESKLPEAEEQFKAVLKVNPSDGQAYFNLGNLHLLKKDYQTAENWIEQGLSRQPDSAFGHFLQGSVELRMGQAGKAEAALRRSLELDPIMANAHLALVNLYIGQKRIEDAIAELKVFVKSFPESPMTSHAKELLTRLSSENNPPKN